MRGQLLDRLQWLVDRDRVRISAGAVIGGLFVVLMCVAIHRAFVGPAPGALVPRNRSLIWRGPATGGVPAVASFDLDNVGGTPVRILSVTSDCGCAKPVVRPELVAPGKSATVEVAALAIPVGEKVVGFGVQTDSLVEREVQLTLKIVGTRKPPFLYLIEGDAVFRGDDSAGASREIGVFTVEDRDHGGIPPQVVGDLPFLRATPAGVEDLPFTEPGTVLRRWKYRLELAQRPATSSFQGRVTAKSPWDPDDRLSLNVVGQLRAGLKAFPSGLTLDRSGRTSAGVVVVCGSSKGKLDLKIEPSPQVPLIVLEEGGDREGKVHRLRVELGAPHSSSDGQSRIIIRDHATNEELELPVKVTSNH